MIMRVEHPGEMLALLNVRDRKLMDVWRIDLRTGAAKLEIENPGDVAWWVADGQLVVRACHGYTPQGGFEVRVRSDASAPWRTLLKTSPEEEALPLGFSKDGRELFLKSSVASDTMRVIAIDIASGGEREIARMDGFDAEDVMIHPARHVIEAVAFAPWDSIPTQSVRSFVFDPYPNERSVGIGLLLVRHLSYFPHFDLLPFRHNAYHLPFRFVSLWRGFTKVSIGGHAIRLIL
jgi:hypothetical protein